MRISLPIGNKRIAFSVIGNIQDKSRLIDINSLGFDNAACAS